MGDGPLVNWVMHTHCTAGMAYMTYLKGIEAGADVIDTAISPFSGGTSQPATETLAYALKELGYEVGVREEKLYEMADYFKPVCREYIENGTLDPISMSTDTQCLNYQIPGGMLSNLLSQLKSLHASDRFDEVLKETPLVRKDLGYPPLVTPTSQLVGTQAVQNILAGERYKNVGAEVKAYCRGEYGRTPAPIDPEVQKKILGEEKPVEGRFAETRSLEARTFGEDDHWRQVSMTIAPEGLKGRGYYMAKVLFVTLDILIEIDSGLKIVGNKELWLKDPQVKINRLDLPDYITNQALSQIQPLLDLNRFPLPMSLHKVELEKGRAILSTRVLPEPMERGVTYHYTAR